MMVLQIAVHIHRVQPVFVMNKVILHSVTVSTRSSGLKEKGGELVTLVFFPDLWYLSLYNYMNESRNKFRVFKNLA